MRRLPRALAQALPGSTESDDGPLILTVAAPDATGHENDVVTLRDVQLENIPHFGPFVASLSAADVNHKPVTVRYLQGPHPIVLSHVECRLRDVGYLPLLQQLLTQYPILRSLYIELPPLAPNPLPLLSAPTLTRLSVRGGLPYAYQFLVALYAPSLHSLSVKFYRTLWDKLDKLSAPDRDHAYALRLSPTYLPALRAVAFEEVEEVPRYSDVSLGCAIGPVTTLGALEDVEVRLGASRMWASDEDLGALARAWPGLRRLVLTCEKASRRLPTFEALVVLEAGCGGLEELVLPRIDLASAVSAGEESQLQTQVQAQAHPQYQYQFQDGYGGGNVPFPSGMVGCEWGHPLRTLRVACHQTRKTITQEQGMALGRRVDALFPNLEPDVQFMSATSADLYMTDWYVVWSGIMSAKAARVRMQ